MNLKLLQDMPPWEWPRDAGKKFQAILTDKRASESDRLIAAELAGDLTVMNDALADTLLGVVKSVDEPDRLRTTAATALGPILEQAYTMEFDDPDDVPITLSTFNRIQDTLYKVYLDESVPKDVRRRILEASVRASQDWHADAIRRAYSSEDRDWMLTAVFSMHYVRGFDSQIIQALKSPDPDIHYEAIRAAGNWGLDAAWPHLAALIDDADTPKDLLIAAIGAVASIRPREAGPILVDLTECEDKDIAEAADDAIVLADSASETEDEEEEDDEGESKWVN